MLVRCMSAGEVYECWCRCMSAGVGVQVET